MAEALLELAVLPARTGIIPSRRGLRAPGPSGKTLGGVPVIVPVPPVGPPETPVRPAVPTPSGLVPAPRESADPGGSGSGTGAAGAAGAAGEGGEAKEVVAGTTVDHLTETYQAHYRSLLGLAALLLDDTASCEDVVQEAFIRVHSARNRVRDRDKTLAYLRQTVVNLSRSALRRRILGLKLLSKPMPDMASAEEGAYDQLERDDLIRAMRGLQRRQREVLVLRYFADMTEAQVAETLGISLGSVKAYGSRGIAALRVAMEAAQS
ncbi:SigE family RNA polymerase sigma factor [Streptomyces sp. NPDC059072]|uniref:SigE family RNA polymerase sigma factor n=1 Tax=Streptomyces sp. NPDC059072 TaxID=3346715 RepID=UPI00367D52B8